MLIVLFVLLGIGAEIVEANAWFIIPDYVSWICFGIAGLLCLFRVISYFSVNKQVRKINRQFKAW